MAKKAALQIVTANHLTEGCSVFLTEEGWSVDHHRSVVAATPEEAATLEARGKQDEDRNLVVAVYLVEVVLDEAGRPEPTHYREKLRVRARPSFWADDQRYAPAALKPARVFAGDAHVSL